MAKKIYMIAPPGEGKTKWLVQKAHESIVANKKCYYVITSDTDREFEKFCEMYRALFNHVCPVNVLSEIESIDSNCVILIDEGMRRKSIGTIMFLSEAADTIYMTLEGYYEASKS